MKYLQALPLKTLILILMFSLLSFGCAGGTGGTGFTSVKFQGVVTTNSGTLLQVTVDAFSEAQNHATSSNNFGEFQIEVPVGSNRLVSWFFSSDEIAWDVPMPNIPPGVFSAEMEISGENGGSGYLSKLIFRNEKGQVIYPSKKN